MRTAPIPSRANGLFGTQFRYCLRSGGRVLDIGFGTGTLTAKLYTHGC